MTRPARSGTAGEARPEEAAPIRRPVHADLVIAGVILAGAALVWAATASFDEVPAALTSGMGPAVFPRLILGVIAALALWLAWTARGRADPEREPVHPTVYLTLVAVLAFMGVLKLLGIYAAILFSTVGIGRLWGERRLWLLGVIGIGLALTTWLVFTLAFKIPLPQPTIGAWLS